MSDMKKVTLVLSDGTKFHGKSFGYDAPVAGEVVFNTAMMGYPESLTDPSYAGQLMTLTFPLVGNYGVPPFTFEENGLPTFMESDKIYASAIIVNDYSEQYSHWNAVESLADWLKREKVPGITGIDTRELTKVLREHGVMMGKILFDDEPDNIPEANYEGVNFVDQVSCKEIIRYNEGAGKKVVLVDCGVKANIIRCLINRGVEVIRVPWNYDYTDMDFDGLFLANGPGDPDMCEDAVNIIRKQFSQSRKPICGICMGNQLLSKAAGATIYKLKYGHRSHNQPVRMVGTNNCYYRPLNQLGLSNFNDYIENPIDSRFKFNPPPLKCGKLFGLCKADRQKEKLQKHCPWHPLLKMKAFTLEINGEAEYIWYCKECDCYYMNPFWRNGEKRILDVYHKVPVRRLIKTAI